MLVIRSISVIMVERITVSGQSSGPALHRHPLKLTGATLAEFGRMVDVEIYIVGNEQIQLTVIIVIHEGRPRRPARITHSRPGRYVSERAITIVLEQMVWPQ